MISASSNLTNNCKDCSSMKMSVIIKIARKNLFAKKLRTLLTVLGFLIGVGAVVFLISFGIGLQKLVEKQVVGSSSIKTIDVTTLQSKTMRLNSKAIELIEGIAGVEEVGKVYTIAGKIKYNNSESSSVVYGVDQVYLDLSNLNKVAGKIISADDSSSAIVNTSFLKIQGITDNNKAIDQKISISFTVPATETKAEHQANVEITIRGIIDSGTGSEVFISNRIVENKGILNASQLKVLATDRDSVSKTRTDIENNGYTTSSPLDTISEIDKIFQLLRIVLVGFGGIGMVIAILGMFNTLTITLLERTREIGLIVTLGGQQNDIKKLFMAEALMLSLLGGTSGVIAAFIVGKICDFALNVYAHSNGIADNLTAFYLDPLLIIASLVITAFIGLVVVYFPARRASRISPLDAMRE